MLDSPYVRRTAVALQLLGLPFRHRSISVFRGMEAFGRINPVIKAPTLVCDDGSVLMDSTLILQYAQALAGPKRRLLPAAPAALAQALQMTGLALAACEKSVQLVYERARPAERRHAPWAERVGGQLKAACDGLEAALARQPLAAGEDTIDLAGLTTAVAWRFIEALTPDEAPASAFPRLVAYSAAAEQLAAFKAAPHGEAEMPVTG